MDELPVAVTCRWTRALRLPQHIAGSVLHLRRRSNGVASLALMTVGVCLVPGGLAMHACGSGVGLGGSASASAELSPRPGGGPCTASGFTSAARGLGACVTGRWVAAGRLTYAARGIHIRGP